MAWESWGPALVSSGVVGLATAIGGYFLKAFVEKGVQHGFDRQVEHLRADLRARDEQINAIRSGALRALTTRHEVLDQRRVKAAEALWTATVRQSKFSMALGFISGMKVEAVLAASEKQDTNGAKLREFGNALWGAAGLDKAIADQTDIAETERLFVPPIAWDAFNAYRSTMARPVLILAAIRSGFGKDIMKASDDTIGLVKTVLPHQAAFLDEHGESGLFILADHIKEKIFSELMLSFSNSDTDRHLVDQASRIAAHTQAVQVDALEGLPEQFRKDPPELKK